MLESGLVIFFAFWLLWIKLPIVTRLKALNYHFTLDLTVSLSVFILFGSTGPGALAAALAALIMSVNISLARRYFGYMYKKKDGKWYYRVGKLNQAEKIRAHYQTT